MTKPDDTFDAFKRRFQGIEAQIPEGSFQRLEDRARGHRARFAASSFAVGAAILLLVAVVALPLSLWRSASTVEVGPASTPSVGVEPSPTPRVITTGEAVWTVKCTTTSDKDCDGPVGLFANNLARSWKMILDQSGGRLSVEPRSCPTFNGLTARECLDVTAALPSGPFCTVVAMARTIRVIRLLPDRRPGRNGSRWWTPRRLADVPR